MLLFPAILALTPFQTDTEVLASTNADGGLMRCEPSIAISGDRVVVAWNDSHGGAVGSPTGTCVGWSTSEDGGKSYKFGGYLAKGAGDEFDGADSRLVATPDGDFYLEVLAWPKGEQALHVYRMDHAKFGEWSELAEPDKTTGDPYVDKPAMDVDGKNLGISYTRGGLIAYVGSDDGGQYWRVPVTVSETAAKTRSGSAVKLVGNRVFVAWIEGLKVSGSEVWLASSDDSGKSFGKPRKMAEFDPIPSPAGYRMAGFEQGAASIFASDAGLAYDPAKHKVFLSFSRGHDKGSEAVLMESGDNGATWSSPKIAPVIEQGGHNIFPSLTLAEGSPVLVFYHQAPDSSKTDVIASWPSKGESMKLDSQPTDWMETHGDAKGAPIQRTFGDYISVATDGKRTAAAWTAGQDGHARVFARVF